MYPRKESYRPLKSLAQLYKVSVIVPIKTKSPLTLAEDVNISPSPIRGRAQSLPFKSKEHRRKKKKKKKRSKKASKGKRKRSKKKKKNHTSVKPSKRKHRQRAISESRDNSVNAPFVRAIRPNDIRIKRRSSRSLPRFRDLEFISSPKYDPDEMTKKYGARSPPLPFTPPLTNGARSPPLSKHRPVIKSSSSRSFKNYASGTLSSPRKSSISTLSALPALPTPKKKDTDPVFRFVTNPTPTNDSLMKFHSFISELSRVDTQLGITFDDMSHLMQDYQSFADKEFRVDPDGIKRLKDIVDKVDVECNDTLSLEERSQLNILKSQSIERLDKAMLLAHRYSMPQWLENDDDTAESSEFISNRRPDYIRDMDEEDTTTE